jgi:hypothetical protein
MKSIQIDNNDFDYVNLTVKTDGGETTYKLTYDYAAIKRAEDSTGVDLKDFKEWSKIKSSHTPALVHAGLHRHHSEVTLEQVTGFLHPATQVAVQNAIFELLFPGLREKIEAAQTKEAQLPNAQGDAITSVPANAPTNA